MEELSQKKKTKRKKILRNKPLTNHQLNRLQMILKRKMIQKLLSNNSKRYLRMKKMRIKFRLLKLN